MMGYNLKLAEARKAAKITQKELAEKLGINRATLSKYENGTIDLNLSQLQKIADALNVTVGYLQGYDLLNAKELVDALKKGDKSTVENLLNLDPGTIISIGEEQLPTDDEMLKMNCNAVSSYMEKMNRAGQAVAVQTVKTLADMPEYQKKDEPGQE